MTAAAAAQGERVLAPPVLCSTAAAAPASPIRPVPQPLGPTPRPKSLAAVGSQLLGEASSESSRQPRWASLGSFRRQAHTSGNTRSPSPPPARAADCGGCVAASGGSGPWPWWRPPLTVMSGAPAPAVNRATAVVVVGQLWSNVDCRTSAGRFSAGADPTTGRAAGVAPGKAGGGRNGPGECGGEGGRGTCSRRSRRAWYRARWPALCGRAPAAQHEAPVLFWQSKTFAELLIGSELLTGTRSH